MMEFDMELVEYTDLDVDSAEPLYMTERLQLAMSADSPRHARAGGPLIVPSQPPSDRGLIDAVSGFINDVTLSASSALDPKDVIQWARFETADINEPRAEGEGDGDISPLLLILGYGSGVQVWLVPPSGEAQEVLSWRQGTVRVLRILPTPQHGDCFASKRPLLALCDSASPGPSFCSLSFISIRGGEQVKSIKFKNQILDVLANKRSVVVAFSERFAVFDAGTLEDRLAITTCYPCPCPLGGSQPVNPLALGDRWLAYADKKLHPAKRSSGGCEGEGVTSYTATVLHAAKSLSKGLRGLGESVAHSLAGGRGASQSPSPPHTDAQQPGVVTILDIEGNEYDDGQDSEDPYDPIVAHFLAHSEAIIALKFDASGMLLVTADRRGHDFHVFRINPHPCGPSLASVHHLYILHRGDTTAKVQDIAISSDSRWTAITTLRGTTHVFAISPYGGACGVRTHTQPRVVNRLSRFHRSAGLPIHAAAPPRSGSPVSETLGQGAWFPNPRLPPYPLPVVSAPLAQLRPTANLPTHTITRTSSGRQRLSSLSEECNSAPLPARARFGLAVMGGLSVRAPAHPALYLITHTGCLLHLLLHARPARSVSKEKVCDESPIEVEVEPVAQWGLARPPPPAPDLLAPLPPASPLLQPHTNKMNCADMCMSEEERWLSQVEIVTHAGPHRRLWMGPQFVFKTYNSTGSNSSLSEAEAIEVDTSAAGSVARSNPVNMPGVRPVVPVLIDSGSASSLEHSPSDSFRRKSLLAESGRAASVCDVQLREDLAEAMKEDHGCPVLERRTPPRAGVLRAVGPRGTVVPRAEPPPGPPADPADPDLYTTPNTDETTFRPVVRAANTLSLSPDMIVRPLPRDTTIPVQNVEPLAKYSPDDEPVPLNTDVVIPAALTQRWHESGFVPVKTKSDEINIDVDVKQVNRDLERPTTAWKDDACESSAPAERESVIESLPKSNRPSDDIQPIARARVKKSPTPKSVSDRDSDVRIKEKSKEREAKEIKGAIKEECKELREPKVSKRKEVRELDVVVLDDKINTHPVTVADKYVTMTSVSPVSSTEKTREDIRKVEMVKMEEPREKSKKSDRTEAVKSNIDETRTKSMKMDKADTTVTDETREKSKKVEKSEIIKTAMPNTREVSKKVEKSETVKVVKEDTREKSKKLEKNVTVKTSVEKTVDTPKKMDEPESVKVALKETREKSKTVEKIETEESHWSKKILKPVPVKTVEVTFEKSKKVEKQENVKAVVEETREKSKSFEKLEMLKSAKQEVHEKSPKLEKCEIVKNEEQAWDLLLNESEKPAVLNVTQTVVIDKFEDKPKAKKIRKGKKGQEDLQAKEDEDSFIEIHAIEEAKTPSCGELVSISTPFEDIDATSSYMSKTRKPRSSKSFTPERDFEPDVKPIEFVPDDDYELTLVKLKSSRKNSSVSAFIEGWPEPSFTRKTTPIPADKPTTDNLKVKHDISTSEISSSSLKEPVKTKKSKSLSPYPETSRKHTPFESEKKDVYVIDSTKDEFPEIQITRGSKNRKKSPQPLERKGIEKELIQPIKSWSSIAAAKSDKKEETITALKEYERIDSWEEHDVAASLEYPKSSNEPVSLQDKLIQLCKRTDIMVAECDAPTELNFVEEHHTDLHDLPPLEPLDFGLDDYKLEVMRDSLLETNDTKLSSPICKINIDDILSSIKETTSKVIESSTFNLVDLEKVPARKEKGFSVVEGHKITTQEVKIDDEAKEESLVVERSSDEDNVTPPVSTDVLLPSAKQSSKYKKSRRKKK
ncbi:LOW QUALITY PROTEIN: uncharacterized protein [Choristoneura fumiferana]|uniref:LOW QUALITY PROTEIN: uncharacterized protein n=1 Tax=Choristoneura fumiferana TaxID=7141 RepID=UPI003D15AA24